MSFKVKADIIENRLYFKFSGRVSKDDLDKLYTDVRFLVADLTPGFDVIKEFSECDIGHINSQPFRKISNYLVTNGLGEVVRVIYGDSLLYDQAENLSLEKYGVRPIYVRSHEEAKAKLEKSIKRNGIRFYVNNLPAEYASTRTTGICHLVNISTGGCSVEFATSQLTNGEEVIMTISFKQLDEPAIEFKVKARVIRTEGETFAVKFMNLDNDQKKQLWKCLILESGYE